MIFFKRDEQDPGVAGIWKTNLDTKRQTQVLAGNDIFLQLRWGPQGWLALSKNHQVWKVKSTGDSLTQLTYGVPHYQPQWSPDGQRLVCWQDGPTAAAQGLVFLDRKGGARTAPAEPLKGYAEGWSSDGTKLLLQHTADGVFGLGVYTFASNKVDLIVPVDIKAGHGGIHGAAWLPNGNGFVWSSDLGLFRTDLASRRTVTLHTGCSGRIYIHPSISSDGRTLIVERVDRHAEDNGRAIYGETNLWTMDLDGNNQRKVEF
ncbi:TolB-like translocation protein [Hymenobacter psychrotolerans]|uniref:hypothetical protein n=1 Tax=Hymenobacter psychrotolerans TaxID=344998 RepID=UPI0011148F5D|nr:hypothetical protein [Hymenobacter psychrotolerans]